jgi:hypothetical protein
MKGKKAIEKRARKIKLKKHEIENYWIRTEADCSLNPTNKEFPANKTQSTHTDLLRGSRRLGTRLGDRRGQRRAQLIQFVLHGQH